ncbi:MAG TPA: hypothetical protein VF165_00660 [Nocardioidaceae bacterium]
MTFRGPVAEVAALDGEQSERVARLLEATVSVRDPAPVGTRLSVPLFFTNADVLREQIAAAVDRRPARPCMTRSRSSATPARSSR